MVPFSTKLLSHQQVMEDLQEEASSEPTEPPPSFADDTGPATSMTELMCEAPPQPSPSPTSPSPPLETGQAEDADDAGATAPAPAGMSPTEGAPSPPLPREAEPNDQPVDEDCGTCIFCLDKVKFGGPGVKRKGCVKLIASRQRSRPLVSRVRESARGSAVVDSETATPATSATAAPAKSDVERRTRGPTRLAVMQSSGDYEVLVMKKSKLTVGAKVYVTMGTHVGRYGEVVGDYDCHGYYPVRIHAVRETGRFRRGQLEDQLDLELWELSNAASKSGDGEWRAPIDQPHALPEGATTDVDEPLGSSSGNGAEVYSSKTTRVFSMWGL